MPHINRFRRDFFMCSYARFSISVILSSVHGLWLKSPRVALYSNATLSLCGACANFAHAISY
jgi:hypothetical protein